MKMFPKIVTALIVILHSTSVFGWGEKGHNAIAFIAQSHLTAKTNREVQRLLGGHNMTYHSRWADELRGYPAYSGFSTWHYANVDDGYTYETMPKNPEGDVVTGTQFCIEQLSVDGQTDSLRNLYLKLLIHFVGDMHCPMHAGYAADLGGNLHPVVFRGSPSNLHRIWDSSLIDAAHTWSALEWAINIDYAMSRGQRQTLQAGTLYDWMNETAELAKAIYADTPRDASLSYDYVNRYTPVIESQLLRGGYRLARLLNEIFDPKNRQRKG